MQKITKRIQGDAHRDGEGRVPVVSAALEHVPIRYVEGVHGSLPNLPAVYGEACRWLKGERLQLEATPEGPFAYHLGQPIAPSAAPNLDGSARSRPASRDPGYLDMTAASGGPSLRSPPRSRKGAAPSVHNNACLLIKSRLRTGKLVSVRLGREQVVVSPGPQGSPVLAFARHVDHPRSPCRWLSRRVNGIRWWPCPSPKPRPADLIRR